MHRLVVQSTAVRNLHNVETGVDCPQAFLSLDFQCMHDVSELQQMFLVQKEL